MKQLYSQFSPATLDSAKSILKGLLKADTRSLVYYASGTRIREGYADLPFDNVVLVDKSFREIVSIKGKIICIGLDSIRATALFNEINVRHDAFVCINEGLSEGNGFYPIHGNWSFSNILPILKDEYLHIACPSYYGLRKWKKKHFNLPQQATLLGENDAEYINPHIFSDYHKYNKQFCVWKVRKQKQMGTPASFQLGNRTCTVQRQNIWSDYSLLDTLFIRCSPCEKGNLKGVAPKVEFIKDYSFEQLLRFCNRNEIETIGIVPWLNHRYESFLSFLQDNETKFPLPKTVNFYHINKQDFRELYSRAEQQAMC